MFFLSKTTRLFLLNFCLGLFITTPTVQPNGLWSQIAPRMASNVINTNPSNQQILQICTCNALSQSGMMQDEVNAELLQTLDSLHVFSHVVPKLAQTNLFFGYLVFAKNFTELTDNIQTLKDRQRLTTFLQENQDLFNTLDQQIKSLLEIESKILFHFYPKQTASGLSILGEAKPKTSMQEKRSYLSKASMEKNIKSHKYWPKARQIGMTGWNEWQQRMKLVAAVTVCMAASYYVYNFDKVCKENKIGLMNGYEIWYGTQKTIVVDGKTVTLAPDPANYPKLSSFGQSQSVVQIAGHMFNLYLLQQSVKKDFDSAYEKQQLLIGLSDIFQVAQKISSAVDKHPEIKNLFVHFDQIKALASYKTYQASDGDYKEVKISAKLKAFLEILNTSSFKGKPSYYFSWQGKIEQAHIEFLEIKDELVPFLEAFGNIDAQLCIVKILNQKNNNSFGAVEFCQPKWIQSNLPELCSINFWHPMLQADKAITNSMFLGGRHGAVNAIVTGANAGGKTTSLSAIMIGQIMAQSLGIAPCQSMTCTPFAKLHTYLDITTNLAENESLFMAQANRAEKLQNSIKSCLPGQKCLSILDEIFTGTRADFASQASFEFAQSLGSMPHSMCILATHFPQLTNLEALKLFTNYKTQDATITSEGTLIYPYKIVPGISDQNIAKHILYKKGILKNLNN
ncbi:MAG: hypothetical protein NTU89_03575 [Candidatus Dependentiae bacterium]|nr:hypothetical protein [Candidatus Dependentiae bacterium]